MKTINQAMIEEHARINNIFDIFISKLSRLTAKDPKSSFRNLLGDFNKFKWNLEKHVFVEEKIIISSYLSQENISPNEDVEQVLNEHKDILSRLLEIEEDLIAGLKPSIEGFLEAINEHEQNEENYFYPKLDEELAPKFRQQIVEKCEEAVIA